MYAAFALSLVLIWRAARIVNFAQGAIAVSAAYMAYSVTMHTHSYWLGFGVALVGGAALGVLVERTAMRFTSHDRPLDAVIVALGVVLVLQAVLGFIYGNEFLALGTPFDTTVMRVGDTATVSRYQVFVFAAVALLVAFLGVALRQDPARSAVARLRVRSRGVAAARRQRHPDDDDRAGRSPPRRARWRRCWCCRPNSVCTPTAMDGVFVIAFTAAVVGGLDSPQGAVIGGLAVGLIAQLRDRLSREPQSAHRSRCRCFSSWCCWYGRAVSSLVSRRGGYEHDGAAGPD